MPPPVRRALLMSLRPRFAGAIMAGTKTVELRRQRIDAEPGTPLIVYASAGVMAIVGTAFVESVDFGEPTEIWARHGEKLGIDRHEFDEYLAGIDSACAISLAHAESLPTPIRLDTLRSEARFHPPQSYRYVSSADPSALVDLAVNLLDVSSLQSALFSAPS